MGRFQGEVTVRSKERVYASFHALFERGQHAVGPHCGFGPQPTLQDLSALLSRCRHCRRSCFPWCGLHASIFLRPFAPPALPGFVATMDALTPAGAGLGGFWPIGPSCHRQVSLRHVVEPSDRSVSNHPWPPSEFGLLALRGLPRVTDRFQPGTPTPVGSERQLGFAFSQQARRGHRPNRVWLPYGPVVRLRLLPTPSRDDAVTFGYKVQTEPWQGLPPCRFHALAGALGQVSNLPVIDRGRESHVRAAPPPSEPDGRISRIRLSS
jgi:hypothetical protein